MFKNLCIIGLLFLLNNCTFNKVVKHHGVHFLEKKQSNLQISYSNKNDVRKILGPPSTKNSFDNEIWIYIERKSTVSDFKSFGRQKVMINDVVILEFDKRGILTKKQFLNKEEINNINFSENKTKVFNTKDTYVKSVLSSLKQKINDPLGKRVIKE